MLYNDHCIYPIGVGKLDVPAQPYVEYAWDYSPMATPTNPNGGNYNRLTDISYPWRVNGTEQSVVNMLYTGANGIDGGLSRISAIQTPIGTDQYQYAGTSRRIWRSLGATAAVVASLIGGNAYGGLDRFGRVGDLHYQKGGGDTLARHQYGYDKAGNRIWDRVTQMPYDGVSHDNDRSYHYEYDGLHRLISAQRGQLNGDYTAIEPPPGSAERYIQWNLDNLGNWSGDPNGLASVVRGVLGEGSPPTSEHHAVNLANEIVQHIRVDDGGAPLATDIITDPAGNLVSDGQYVYQYDAWDRLVQVNLVKDPLVQNPPEGMPGQIIDSGQLGDLVCRFTYDGLGRLIRKETPVSEGVTGLQRKDFYYDGVRRIGPLTCSPTQTASGIVLGDSDSVRSMSRAGNIYRPGLVNQQMQGGGEPPPETPIEEQFVLESEAGIANDELPVQLAPTTQPDGSLDEPPPQTLMAGGGGGGPPYYETDREYFYGPDYVDEFIGQWCYDAPAMLMLQDANYNP